MDKVYVVFAYDHYYPRGDNIKGIYKDEVDAIARVTDLRTNSSYDNVDYETKEVK